MAGLAGRPGPPVTLKAKDGTPYVRGIDSWYSGVNGLLVHRIPEEPDVFTVSHHESGLRLARSRFATVHDACVMTQYVFGGKIDFTKSPQIWIGTELFAGLMRVFIMFARRVKKNRDNVKRIHTEEVLARALKGELPKGGPL